MSLFLVDMRDGVWYNYRKKNVVEGKSMYTSKNTLISRITALTGKNSKEFISKSVKELSILYDELSSDENKIYINVPYKEKDLAKILGAKYDGEKKMWYIPPGADAKIFERWLEINHP